MSSAPSSCPNCSAPLRATDRVCPFCQQVVDVGVGPRPPDPLTPPPLSTPGAEPPAAPPTRPSTQPVAVDVDSAATEPVPWEQWRQLGLFKALWRTWRESVFNPVPFFRRLPPRGGVGPALAYAVLATLIGLFFSLYWSIVEGALAGGGEEGMVVGMVGGLIALLFGMAFLIPLYVGFLFVSVGIIHVGFLVVGAGRRGYEATFRAVAYASSPIAFSIFPFFGPYLSTVWGMVLLYIGVREVQRTTNARAALGFLIPFLAFLFFFIVLSILLAILVGSVDLAQPV